VLAVAFTIIDLLEMRTAVLLARNSVLFGGRNTWLLLAGSAPLWIPTLGLDVACFAIWRLLASSNRN
jgi:hypothetical protein